MQFGQIATSVPAKQAIWTLDGLGEQIESIAAHTVDRLKNGFSNNRAGVVEQAEERVFCFFRNPVALHE